MNLLQTIYMVEYYAPNAIENLLSLRHCVQLLFGPTDGYSFFPSDYSKLPGQSRTSKRVILPAYSGKGEQSAAGCSILHSGGCADP